MGHGPIERFSIVELVAELEAEDAALRCQSLEQCVRHIAGDIVHGAEPVVGGDERGGADIERGGNRLVGSMRDVNHHAQAVHLADDREAAFVQAVPLRHGAAGIGVVAGPVVGGELHGAHAQAVHLANHGWVAIQIEAAFDIEHGRDFSSRMNALDLRGVAGDFDAAAIALDLFDGGIQHAQRLSGLQAGGIVVFRHEDGKEERSQTAFAGPRQVELAVRFALADIAAVIELAVHGMNVAIEDECAGMQRKRAGGDSSAVRRLCAHERRHGCEHRQAVCRGLIIEAV